MVKNIKSIILFGFLIWLVPFLVSFIVFPLYTSNKSFFDTIMSSVLVLITVYSYYKYQKNEVVETKKEGLIIGIIWMFMSLLFDFFVFIIGPLKMEVISYITDIGLAYLVIPIITFGLNRGINYENRREISKNNS